MLRAWTEERFSRSGRFFTINSAHVIPKPRQRPHPPIYQVCVSQDGRTLDQLATNRDIYVATLKKTGRSEAEVAALLQRWGVSRHIYVAPTDAQALEEPREAELWYAPEVPGPEDQHPSLQPGFRALAERLAKVTWEGLVAETLAFGSPETVARHIETMRQMGVGQVLCWMNFGGLPQDKVRRSMELFAREVMPRFR